MCLLTVFPSNAIPNQSYLENGASYNDGGHGYAILVNGVIQVRRSMHAEGLIEEFIALRTEHPEGPALFHSRITTHGVEDKTNCHPFRVSPFGDTFVAHNGILPSIVHPDKNDNRSDTRIFAEDFLPMVSNWGAPPKQGGKYYMSPTTKTGRRKLERWMGFYNKMAIITTDPRFTGNLFILNEAEGTWKDGVWYSNSSYLPYTQKYTVIPYTTPLRPWKCGEDGRWYQEELPTVIGPTGTNSSFTTDCNICRSFGSVGAYTKICYMCHSCNDCFEDIDDCLCQENWVRRMEYANRPDATKEDRTLFGVDAQIEEILRIADEMDERDIKEITDEECETVEECEYCGKNTIDDCRCILGEEDECTNPDCIACDDHLTMH